MGFDYSEDAVAEAGRFFRAEHREINLYTVRDILDEQTSRRVT